MSSMTDQRQLGIEAEALESWFLHMFSMFLAEY